jgi:hypothetical protein
MRKPAVFDVLRLGERGLQHEDLHVGVGRQAEGGEALRGERNGAGRYAIARDTQSSRHGPGRSSRAATSLTP